jgi:hypothetical protein
MWRCMGGEFPKDHRLFSIAPRWAPMTRWRRRTENGAAVARPKQCRLHRSLWLSESDRTAANKTQTSDGVASLAAETLASANESKIAKSLAASALSQSEEGRQTGAEMKGKRPVFFKASSTASRFCRGGLDRP